MDLKKNFLGEYYTNRNVEVINLAKGEYFNNFTLNRFQGYLQNRKAFAFSPREDLSQIKQIEFELNHNNGLLLNKYLNFHQSNYMK